MLLSIRLYILLYCSGILSKSVEVLINRIDTSPKPKCTCVPFEWCLDEGNHISEDEKADSYIVPRMLPLNLDCRHQNQICCVNFVNDSNSMEPEMDTLQKIVNGNIYSFQTTKNSSSHSSTITTCGISRILEQAGIESRILSNTKSSGAQFAEFPWNVLLLDETQFLCGGSIIHPKVVLTAAHCIKPHLHQLQRAQSIRSDLKNRLIIRAGEWDIRSVDESLPYQESKVSEIIIHPRYDQHNLHNDMAVLILMVPFEFRENVGAICLPKNPQLPSTAVNNKNPERIDWNHCIVSGWGRDAHINGQYSSILKKVEIPVVRRSQCIRQLRNTKLGPLFKLDVGFLCAGGEKNRDACKGDGGGPLICPYYGENRNKQENSVHLVQVGIVSWGVGCGNDQIPGIYTHVGMFTDWIDYLMVQRQIQTIYNQY